MKRDTKRPTFVILPREQYRALLAVARAARAHSDRLHDTPMPNCTNPLCRALARLARVSE